MAHSASVRRTVFLAAVLVAALASTTSSGASTARTQATGRETIAAIDPSLVAGRGADLGIVEQEAENAETNGTILPFGTSAYTLSGEASGRQAVKLAPGQSVAFTLTRPANAVTIRYAIPDAPTGGGIDAPLTVGVDNHGNGHGNTHPQTITLTSKYSYLYNLYPFTNDPNAGVLHPDWWITECSCVPAATTPPPTVPIPFRPMHFYDEQRVLLGPDVPAGRRRSPHGPCRLERRVDSDRSRRLPECRRTVAAAAQLIVGHQLRRRPTRHPGLLERLRPRDPRRPAPAPVGVHPRRNIPGEPSHRRRRRDDRGCRQLVVDREGPPGHAQLAGARRLRAHGRRLLRQVRVRGRESATSISRTSRSKATCASASTPIR